MSILAFSINITADPTKSGEDFTRENLFIIWPEAQS
jgi:hypothetical protein